jgi:hypothetical protein
MRPPEFPDSSLKNIYLKKQLSEEQPSPKNSQKILNVSTRPLLRKMSETFNAIFLNFFFRNKVHNLFLIE